MYVQLNIELSIYFTNIIRAINRHNLNKNNVLMYDFQSINVNANESKWNKSVTIRIESKVSISLPKPVSLIISEDYTSYRRLYQFCSFNRSDLYSLITAKIGWLCIEHWAQSLKGKKIQYSHYIRRVPWRHMVAATSLSKLAGFSMCEWKTYPPFGVHDVRTCVEVIW